MAKTIAKRPSARKLTPPALVYTDSERRRHLATICDLEDQLSDRTEECNQKSAKISRQYARITELTDEIVFLKGRGLIGRILDTQYAPVGQVVGQ